MVLEAERSRGHHRSLGHGGEQLLLLAKMPVQRRLFDAKPLSELSRADALKANLIEKIKRFGNYGFTIQKDLR